MVFLFNIESFWIGFETEALILLAIVIVSTQWRYYLDYRNFYSRTNRFEDYYEMHKHFLENKIVYQLNDRLLNDLKCSVDEIKEDLIHIKHDMANNLKNQSEPNKLILQLISDIHEKLDNKNDKNN